MTILSREEELTIGSGSYLVNTPMLWVNNYIQEKLAAYLSIGVPFFPPSPSSIDDLTGSWVTIEVTNPQTQLRSTENFDYQGIRCTYDRLTRLRRSPFPHIKGEQLLYYFFATAEGVTDKMVALTEMIVRLLDREDETAEEINNWSRGRIISLPNGRTFSPQFYFHKFRVYQLEEVADLIDFGTARTYGGNKIIIEYEYHPMPELTNNTPS